MRAVEVREDDLFAACAWERESGTCGLTADLSRYAETPRHFRFVLNEDGSDYTVAAADGDDADERSEAMYLVLEDAPQKLTRLDILDEWPDDFARPDVGTLGRWLKAAVAAGRVQVEGSGRKADPLRYWVAGAEARWRQRPFYEEFEKQTRDLKLPFVSLRDRKRAEAAEPPVE